jgi:flagellar hook assembly protein FlgD
MFWMPRGQHVHLAAYDTRGRRMKTLIDAEVPAGAGHVTWDGTDERGSTVAPGLYFLRLSAAGATGTVRLLRVQ